MLVRLATIGICLFLLHLLAACSTRTPLDRIDARDIVTAGQANPSFVTHGGELQEIAMRRPLAMAQPQPWEATRNDGPVFDRDTPIYAPLVFLEVRHREHLRTINGRPREFSSTSIRSIRRELRH